MARKPRSLADRAEAVVRKAHEREELTRKEFQLAGLKYWLVMGASVLVAVALAAGAAYFYVRVRPRL